MPNKIKSEDYIPRYCQQCQQLIPYRKGEQNGKPRKFCNNTCHGQWEAQHKNKRIPIKCADCENMFMAYPSTKRKYCSHTCYSNHHRWKTHGQGHLPYAKGFGQLSKYVRQRDNNQCMLCQSTIRLEVHHIDHNKHNSQEQNLITLCQSCHSQETRDMQNWPTWKKQLSSLLRRTHPHLFPIT